MKTTPRLLALLVTFIAPAIIHAADSAEKESENSELGDSMSTMNAAFRKLRRQVADPKQNEASVALVAKLRKASVDSEKEIPAKVAHLPAADQAAAKAAYADKMKELIATIDELDAALKAGKNEDAVGIIKELTLQEEAGHKQFRPPSKDK